MPSGRVGDLAPIAPHHAATLPRDRSSDGALIRFRISRAQKADLDLVPIAEGKEIADHYKKIAGLDPDGLSARPSLDPPGRA
jgi:hypothetical protein